MARSDDFRNLKNEVTNMYKDRVDFIHQTRHAWKKDKENYQKETLARRNEISELRNEISELRDETHNLLANFIAQDKERAKEVKDLRGATRSLLAEFNKNDKARAKEVESLRTEAQALLAEFNEIDKARAKEIDDLKAEVANLITGYKKEHEEAVAAWKDLIAVMTSARGAALEKPKPEPKKTKEKVSGFTNKEKKILTMIKNNPQGISLPEIAYVMGVAFVTITKDVKKLLADGLIKKEENRYISV